MADPVNALRFVRQDVRLYADKFLTGFRMQFPRYAASIALVGKRFRIASILLIAFYSPAGMSQDIDKRHRFDIDSLLTGLRTDHPRLFFNRNYLDSMKQQATGEMRSFFRWLTHRAADVMGRPLEVRDRGEDSARIALLYLLTGEPEYLAAAKALLETTVRFYRQRDVENLLVNWFSTSRINALCAYDWLFDYLSEEERRNLGKSLLDHVENVQRGDNRNLSDHTGGFYGTPSLLWYAGIALYGANVDNARAERFLREGFRLHEKMLKHRADLSGNDGGLGTYSLNYAMGHYPWADFNFFHNMKSAFNQDVAARWTHPAYLVHYILWNRLPGDRWFGSGDTDHEHNRLPFTKKAYTHLAQVRHFYGESQPKLAALSAWLQQKFPRKTFDPDWPAIPFLLSGLSGTPDASPPSKFPFPSARHFEGLGQIFMHSGWSEDDTYAQFTVGGRTARHKHYDALNFLIFHKGFLALDSGSRPEPGSHLPYYFSRTVAHNSLLIRMPGEKMPPYWGRFAPGEPELPVPNDGGQYKKVCSQVKAFETRAEYTYVIGDATDCYHPDKAVLVERRFLFIPKSTFVILDHVVSTSPSYRKTWLMHTAEKPLLDGQSFSVFQEKGLIRAQTLLPPQASISAVGGPGKQFWNDGRNWPFPDRYDIDPLTPLLGQWRIQVSPLDDSKRDIFLHLLKVGDRAESLSDDSAHAFVAGSRISLRFGHGEKKVQVQFDINKTSPEIIQIHDENVRLEAELADSVAPQEGLNPLVQEMNSGH